ncbi:hypothetical protein O181_019845 [Austropuccinia psidii MF-1]|uniref:Ribosome assembly protein 1 n=1 Tax=Austropuccinia psidii MF-1 TaxID=1389203 RepID=A0A9Q3GVH9_9BASI|nr:hypothetical protein [Austropuccinia psidii MF-1]
MAASTSSQSHIRNVCILAHVDHGKSSYADSLLASNHIITARMAGQLRYLDSRQDEQERGITMKSSSVSLSYTTMRKQPEDESAQLEHFTINLIDTPGHVDFTTEVSTASRLCDGALILIDAVEGVCTQTISVLRQAWSESLKPILVINKVDRLITELRLSPTEAYYHLLRLVEHVNSIMGSFFFTERVEQDLKWREAMEQSKLETKSSLKENFKESDDQDIYFDPAKGDVLFSSAIDNWSFSIPKFASIWSKKLGIKEDKLNSCLWGDFFFDPKSKMVLTKKQLNGRTSLKPMFVQFILDNLWAVYESVALNPDMAKTEKIIKSLELKIKPQDLKSKDSRNLVIAICSQWLPISTTTFRAIVAKVPDPIISQSTRLPKMLYPDLMDSSQAIPHNDLERDLYAGKADESSHVVAYVSKMFAIPTSELPQFQRKQLTAEEMRERGRIIRQAPHANHLSLSTMENSSNTDDINLNSFKQLAVKAEPEMSITSAPDNMVPSQDFQDVKATTAINDSSDEKETLIGFARIYSGIIKVNQKLTCVLPKYNAKDPVELRSLHLKSVTVESIYKIMGRSLVEIPEIKAGHVFGIGGLAGRVLRNATLCGSGVSPTTASPEYLDEKPENFRSTPNPAVVNLAGVQLASAPIVRVSLEPRQPSDMPKLVEGLRLLSQSDPCVETLIQDSGEHVILTAGELHLERCLRDLRERFAKIPIQASKPIIPFRETAVQGIDMPPPKTKDHPRGTIKGSVLGGLVNFTIRAVPLPEQITAYLVKYSDFLKDTSLRREFKPTSPDDFSEKLTPTKASGPNGYQRTATNIAPSMNNQDSLFWSGLDQISQKSTKTQLDPVFQDLTNSIWAFGPKRSGPNLLLDKLPGSVRSLKKLQKDAPGATRILHGLGDTERTMDQSLEPISLRDFDDLIETAFQLATFKGPLCAEPMSGICFSLEELEIDKSQISSFDWVRSKWSQLTGELISSVQEAFRNAMLDWSPRLMLAMYTCEIQATTEVLGKVYGVVSRRRGVIKSEEIKDGTTFYTIGAKLPIIESFGFNDELMKKTSGVALPQLVFDGFEMINQDPFWVPKTEAELEDFGSLSDKENLARKYMDQVRKRKGMFVEKKIVQHAEKQRTMKR